MNADDGDPNRPGVAERLAALRREAYSRSGSEASFAALRELELSLQRPALRTEVEVSAVSETAAPVVPQQVIPQQRTRLSPFRFALIAVAVLVIAAVGFSFGRSTPAPTSSASATLPAEARRGSATLALLETPQRAADMPPFGLGTDIIPATVHILPTGLQGEVIIYGARTSKRLVCLVAVTVGPTSNQLGDSAETCATVHQFVTDGIRLRVTTSELVIDDAGFSNFAYFEYLWTGNGVITAISNHYPFPAAPHL
jgi:hypothetical protein